MDFGDSGSNARAGQDLPEIETDDIAFHDISLQQGGNPVKVSEPWQEHPPVHASLVSVASAAGLLAVAGPSKLVIAKTEELRKKAIPKRLKKNEERLIRVNGVPVEGKAYAVKEDEPSPVPADAHLVIDTPRLSHVAFSVNEKWLVIVSENGGGLAVYETSALAQGNKDHSFMVNTNGVSVRHLLPNPNMDDALAPLFAIVLTNGQLLLADLNSRSLRKGQNGEVFHDNVFSASWSKLGKQIIAGKGDGSCAQVDQQGALKDTIPVAPQLADMIQADYQDATNVPITTILWLETNKFLIIYSPVYGPQDPDGIPPMNDSAYFLADRKKGEPITFHKLAMDPCPPFGLERLPANHFITRLYNWEPRIADMFIATSTASLEIGVLASGEFSTGIDDASKQKAWQRAENYAGIVIKDDNNRAGLPTSYVGDDAADTSAIGTSIDFGSRILASSPIPTESDTIEQSPFPLPCFCMVNTDGLLHMWWLVYPDSIRQKKPHPQILHQQGPFTTYSDLATKYIRPMNDNAETIPPEIVEPHVEPSGLSKPAAPVQAPQSIFGQDLTGQRPATPTTATPTSNVESAAKPLFGGASALGGNKASPWGASLATPGGTAFGKSSFWQPSTSGASAFGTSAFGQTSTPAASSFGKPSFAQPQSAGGSGFAQAAQQNGTGFGQIGGLGQNRASPWAAAGQSAAPSPFANAGKSNPFAGAGQTVGSPFANAGKNAQSPFATTGRPSPFAKAGQTAQSPFAAAAQSPEKSSFGNGTFGKPSLSNETSTGSTATLGSNGTFGGPSTPAWSSFNSKPTLSTESTTGGSNGTQSLGGLPSLSQGFKLGSTFKGDGTAHDDLPKPKNPGGDWFKTLDDENKKPEIKQEPGTEKEISPKDFPAQKASGILGQSKGLDSMPLPSGLFGKKEGAKTASDAPLPPDPSTFDYKKKQAEMPSIFGDTKKDASVDEAPLPPDPSTFNYKKKLAEMAPPPGAAEKTTPPRPEKDVPIAGSPPQDITHSQTFSPTDSEAGPPEESGSEDWDDEDEDEQGNEEDEDDAPEEEDEDEEGDEGDEEDDDDDDDEDGFDDEDDEEEEEAPYQPENPASLQSFLNRVTPAAPKSPDVSKSKAKSTTPKAQSYTPAGLPKGPILEPPSQRKTGQSPRSPSPQRPAAQLRSVTSPIPQPAPEMRFPPQIKTISVPPAKPVERERHSAPPEKPRVPTAGELADEQDAHVKAVLARPIEPSKEMPNFHTHQDYTGAVETPGVGGHIEKVFRDVNSMIDVVGLNARSLMTFIEGHDKLRKPGRRSREDLEDLDAWTLGEIGDLGRIMDDISKQLEAGKLEDVRNKLELLLKEQSEAFRLKVKTSEMRKQITTLTDPARRAEHDAAPLDVETAARQSELRIKLRDVYQLLSDVEQSMSLLRADLASASSKMTANGKAQVPTVESIERTILRMTAMVEKTSGDVDLLEAQIRRLPNGIASLRNGGLGEDYEDDLAARLGGSKLLTYSPSRKNRTPQKYPRMAADGSALGMSGMFGSRFQTPPNASIRASPSMRSSVLAKSTNSALRQSTGSFGSSPARKKMSDVTDDEVDAYYARLARRKDVLGALKKGIVQQGTRVVKVE